MSVVVWDGKTLAADKQGTCGDLMKKTTKIKRAESGDLLAWVGTSEYGLVLAQWYENGCKPEDWPEFQKSDEWSRLIVVHKGKAYEYETTPTRQPVETVPMAWGSGSDFALGALAMGADAAEAVRVASKYSVSCGFGVDAFRVLEKK